jgi:hypothetical protein
MNSLKSIVAQFALLLLVGLAGCEESTPTERAADDVEDAAEEVGEAAEDAADEVGDAIDDAGDKVKDSTGG